MAYVLFRKSNDWEGEEVSEPLQLNKVRIVHAGPTCGKGVFSAALSGSLVPNFDTDTLIQGMFPDWFGKHMYRSPRFREAGLALHSAVGDEAYKRLSASAGFGTVCLTNLWDAAFRSGIQPSGLVIPRLPLGVFRDSPEEITELSRGRDGSEIPLDLSRKWVSEFKVGASSAFNNWILIPRGGPSGKQYLTDVLEPAWPWLKPIPRLSAQDLGLQEEITLSPQSRDDNRGGAE